ncbi:MAG: hypothetical protein WDZ39_00195 [Candidatus Spechtbacterales bacterium]
MSTSLIPDKKNKRSSGEFVKLASSSLREFASSFGLLGIVVAVYFAISFWGSLLLGELEDIKEDKRSIVNSVSAQGDVMEFRDFAVFIHELQETIENQSRPSRLFGLFEDSMHERATISSFSFNMETSLLELGGATPSFEVLGQQILIWTERSEFVESIELGSFGKNSEGGIDFQVTIEVGEDYF